MSMELHNLNYYSGFLEAKREFNENNEQRKKVNSFFYPESLLIEPLSHFLTYSVALPFLRHSYGATGDLASKVSGFFSPTLAASIKNRWKDPFSTETLLKVGGWIERNSRTQAVRTPTQNRFLHYVDTCFISGMQHLYIFSKDINSLLNLPQYLRNLAKSTSTEADPSTIVGKGWKQIKKGTEIVADSFLLLIDKILSIIVLPLQYLLGDAIFQPYAAIIEGAKNRLQGKTVASFLKVIDQKEKEFRQKLVNKLTYEICRHSIGLATKTLIQTGVWVLYNKAFNGAIASISDHLGHEMPAKTAKVASIGIKIAGLYLWMRCFTPTVNRLYESYNEKFDPEVSTFKELYSSINRWNVALVVKYMRNHSAEALFFHLLNSSQR